MAAQNDVAMTEPTKRIFLKLANGTKIESSPLLPYISGAIKDNFAADDPNSDVFEFPLNAEVQKEEVELMNDVINVLESKMKEEFRTKAEDRNHWVEHTAGNKEALLPLADGVSDQVLIRAANLGDFLILHPLTHFACYVLAERCQNKSLSDIREILHEEDDFNEEERQIISQCPELSGN